MEATDIRAVAALAIALGAALVLMPLALALGQRHRYGLARRSAAGDRARAAYLGGTGLALAVLLATFTVGTAGRDVGLLLAGLVLAAAGLLEDRIGGTWRSRSLLAAIAVVVSAEVTRVDLRSVAGPGTTRQVATVGILLLGAWAMAHLDQVKAVAVATTAASSLGLLGIGLITHQSALAVLGGALCGACLAFAYHHRHHGRLGLGTGGALFLGLVLAGGAVQATSRLPTGWAVPGALALLAVPLLDLAVVGTTRLLTARRLFTYREDHVAHRLARLGLGPAAVVWAHVAGALLAAAAVAVAAAGHGHSAFIAAALALFCAFGVGLMAAGNLRPADEAPIAHPWRRLALLAVALPALALLAAIPPTLAAGRQLQRARGAFNAATRAAGSVDLTAASADFTAAGRYSAQASANLASPLIGFARLLPGIGSTLGATRAMASGAQQMARAGSQATTAGQLLMPAKRTGGGPGGGLGQIEMGPWQQAQTLLGESGALVRQALAQVSPAPGPLVPAVASARREFLARGQQALADLGRAQDAAGLVPTLFGEDKPHTWLLAIQNPVELRATGGLIGAYGILQGSGGKLALSSFSADNALPKITTPPPAPDAYLARYGRFGVGTIWQNVNMSPDFPTTANQIAAMWQEATGTTLDGVISMDAQSLDALLGAVGPVSLSGGDTITQANFLPVALNQAYVRFATKASRVNYLLEVGQKVWARLAAGQFGNLHSLAGALSSAVTGRDLQVWMPGHEPVLARLGVDGALVAPPPGQDSLFVVGQNAAGNKLDYYAQRSIDYSVTINAAGQVSGQLGIQFDNATPPSATQEPGLTGVPVPGEAPGYNRSYTSVYLPAGAEILGAQVDRQPSSVESESEAGMPVYSHFLGAVAGGESTLVLQTTGVTTTVGDYRLSVRHQPTLNPDHFRLEVILPAGETVVGPLPPGATASGRLVTWSGALVRDEDFTIRYGPASAGTQHP